MDIHKYISKFYLFLILTGLAVSGNLLRFPLFFGVDFIFGSAAVIIAVIRLGILPGIVISVIGSSVTLILWEHPFALIIFTTEALIVGIAMRKYKDVVLVDACYWLMAGMPLVFMFYAGIMDMGMSQVSLIALKQTLNGIFNALLAVLAMLVWDIARRPGKTFKVAGLLQIAIFTAVLIPTLTLLATENRHLKTELENAVFEKLAITAIGIEAHIDEYIETSDASVEKHLPAHTHVHDNSIIEHHLNWVLHDDKDNIILQTMEHRHHDTGEFSKLDNERAIWIPSPGESNKIERWKSAQYIYSKKIERENEKLTLELMHSAAPIINQIHNAHARSMIILSILIIIAGSMAILMGRFLTMPLTHLTSSTHQLSQYIARNEKVDIPDSRIKEVNLLAQEFREMSNSLQRAFDEVNYLASQDSLTKIYNRRRMLENLEEELLRAKRYGHSFSIIFYDIDHFKNINDNQGHATGDEVLIEMTHLIQKLVRKTDIFGRWGGEEFILALPQTNLNTAIEVAEKMRSEIEKHRFTDEKLTVTISIGISEYNQEKTINELLDKADKELYRAKEGGRNRTCYTKY